jgi:hypothetical protein
LAPQEWEEKQLGPFITPVYKYTNAELAYEEADGDYKETPKKRVKIEKETKKLSHLDTYLKKNSMPTKTMMRVVVLGIYKILKILLKNLHGIPPKNLKMNR